MAKDKKTGLAAIKAKIKKPNIKLPSFKLKKDKEKEPTKSKGLFKNFGSIGAKTIIILAAAVLLTFLVTVGVLIYGVKNDSPFVKGVARVVPYPAAVADWRFVSAYSYIDQVEMLKNYYREYKGTDFGTDEGKTLLSEIRTEVLDRLVEDQIVAKEAKRMKITLSNEEVNNGFNELVSANGGEEEFASILNKYYKLTMDQFKTKIYRTQMLREKVAEAINNDQTVTEAAKKQADEVYTKTQVKGADFAVLARENSQDTATAASGGDLGYFKKGTMVTEFENAAFALKEGQISKPVKTVYGYHIIKLIDKKGDQIKASHILIKIRDYNEWLESKITDLKAKKSLGFIPGIWKLIKTD